MSVDQAQVDYPEHRSAVGPPDKYDIIGAQQFCVCISHGLREHHAFCDIGCGSLRGGRLFITYLLPGKYYGIEPNARLVNDGIDLELGGNVIGCKHPQFLFSDDFYLQKFEQRFDFILAQSIFSHAYPEQIDTCLWQVAHTLVPDGKFLGTYFQGAPNYTGNTWASSPCATYTKDWMVTHAHDHGLKFRHLPNRHESGQTWFLMQHRD